MGTLRTSEATLFLGVTIVLLPLVATAQDSCPRGSMAAELYTGTAWSPRLPLDVSVAGERTRIRARYGTRPFSDAPYYTSRIGIARADGRGVEAEMLHHKLYLENPAPPIERFEVSHGYNLPMVNVVTPSAGAELRVGVGLVVAHPEGRIAGREVGGLRTALGGGYHIAGVTTQVAIGRRHVFGRGPLALIASPEAKLTASWARMCLGDVGVTVPNVALHVLAGLGARRCR